MKTYKVVGPVALFGHEPGEEFDRDFSETQEHRYIDSGRVEVVGEATEPSPEEQSQQVGDESTPTSPEAEGTDPGLVTE